MNDFFFPVLGIKLMYARQVLLPLEPHLQKFQSFSQVAGIMKVYHHAQLTTKFFLLMVILWVGLTAPRLAGALPLKPLLLSLFCFGYFY
jgi:hypothetical protein